MGSTQKQHPTWIGTLNLGYLSHKNYRVASLAVGLSVENLFSYTKLQKKSVIGTEKNSTGFGQLTTLMIMIGSHQEVRRQISMTTMTTITRMRCPTITGIPTEQPRAPGLR